MKQVAAIAFALMIALVWCGQAIGSGEGAATLFNQGNAFYAKGDYASAVKSYAHALEQRVADPRLEQNIGSAYVKLGDVGRAIYHFERGLLLSPRDPDLRFNLEHAQSLRADEIPEDRMLLSRLFDRIVSGLTPGEWIGVEAVLFVFLFLLVILLMVIQGRAKPVLFWCAFSLAALHILIAPFCVTALYRAHATEPAVVVAEKLSARSGPGADQSEAFVVHGGMPCTILEHRAGWVKVTIATGLSGWMPEADVWPIRF